MGGIRGSVEEIVFRGVKLTFDLTHRFQVIARVNDDLVNTFSAMPVVDAMSLIEEFANDYVTGSVDLVSTNRITTEHGYVLVLVLQHVDLSILVTFELDRV